ncbi:MAG: radical SAM protein [Bacteroidales bacterium]|jgi:sulfatase maturation enzyme AslB (radical SAM superfamily)|nr:radical SAM protein [Bacteroidales bacterium]MDD4214446.1 radical SAM protein [Bacteroidales bacterium]
MNVHFEQILKKLKLKARGLNDYCDAPLNNVYFRIDGFVLMCCSNNEDILGVYPEQSVKELFEGEKRKEISERFRKGEVLGGCSYCYGKLMEGNFQSAIFQAYKDNFKHSNIPASVEFELSNRCNLKCVMCNSLLSDKHEDKSVVSKEIIYDHKFVEQLLPYIPYLKRTNFKGGEPFLIDLYYDIWEEIIRLNKKISVSVTSNGTILNDKVRSVLSRTNFDINISIDSFNKERYEQIRENASYNVFYKNLLYFIEYTKEKNTTFTSCTCLMTNNFQDIPEVFNFADKHQFGIFINYVEYPLHLSLKSLSSKDLADIIRFLNNNVPSAISPEGKKNLILYQSMLKQIHTWMNDKRKLEEKGLDKQNITNFENSVQMLIERTEKYYNSYFHEREKTGSANQAISLRNQIDKFNAVYKKTISFISKENVIQYFLETNEKEFIDFFEMSEFQIIEKIKQKNNSLDTERH